MIRASLFTYLFSTFLLYQIRFQLNQYLINVLSKKKKELLKTEKEQAATLLIKANPKIIDYYIKYKEENEEQVSSISKEVVAEVKTLFNDQLQQLTNVLKTSTDFYKENPSSYEESLKRVGYLNNDHTGAFLLLHGRYFFSHHLKVII